LLNVFEMLFIKQMIHLYTYDKINLKGITKYFKLMKYNTRSSSLFITTTYMMVK
jgi:hypothetical protein